MLRTERRRVRDGGSSLLIRDEEIALLLTRTSPGKHGFRGAYELPGAMSRATMGSRQQGSKGRGQCHWTDEEIGA